MHSADLVAIYDAHGPGLAQEAATTLVDELAEAELRRGTVAQIGCVDGTMAALLVAAGYDVLAISPSPACLAVVTRDAPAATTQQAAVAAMALPTRLVAVVAVDEALSHDLQIDLEETIERIHAALRPGGVLLLDLPGQGRHGGLTSTNAIDTDRAFLITETREAGYRLQRTHTVFTEMTDGSYRRRTDVHELRLYDPADVRAALSRAGFVAIRSLDRYGATGPQFGSGWYGFIAERP